MVREPSNTSPFAEKTAPEVPAALLSMDDTSSVVPDVGTLSPELWVIPAVMLEGRGADAANTADTAKAVQDRIPRG